MPVLNEKRLVAGLSRVREYRDCDFAASGAEIREASDGARKFVGHASVFNSRTAIGNPLSWGFYEEIDPAAFDKTLQECDARFLVDHDSRLLVARQSAGDLTLGTDGVGLTVDADLDEELSYVKDLVRNLDKRRVTGMSFGFQVIRDEWFTEQVSTSDGQTADVEVRRLLEVKLIEVSAVTFPAYSDTDAGVRSMVDEVRKERLGGNKTSPESQGGSAPADEATRSDEETTPADEATSSLETLALRERSLKLRVR